MKDTRNVSKLRVLFFGIAVFLSSCRPVINLDRPGDYDMGAGMFGKVDFSLEFKSFWSGMNHHYLYWDIDSTDWDWVYDTYRPKFEALGVVDLGDASLNTKLNEAKGYIKEMTRNLSDGHLAIIFWDEDIFQPAGERVKRRPDYSEHDLVFLDYRWSVPGEDPGKKYDNWFERVIKPTLDPGSAMWFPTINDSAAAVRGGFNAATGHCLIGSGPDYILYFYFNEFALSQHFFDTTSPYRPVIDQFMTDLTEDPNVKGVIFDLRGNTGGAAPDVGMILAPLIDKPLKIGEIRSKSGPGRLDYTPWGPFTILPVAEHFRTRNPNIPVVALVNEFSISCGEFTPMGIKELPNGYVMGKRTYGATGPRVSDNNPLLVSGGAFKGSYLVKQATFAAWATRGVRGENYEGIGVPPDETLPFGDAEWNQFNAATNPKDPWFERAVQHIKSKL
ncbi:hypothetical protein AGMMS49942_08840 [Spirochaetia bacterium]|nr:hypothetical protein AGMMS49942_08840 [Spirochaetia bacterium]